MITNKFTIYTKHQKIALKIIDIVQITLGIGLTISIILAMLITQSELSIWSIIIGISGIISLLEIVIRKTFNKQSLLHTLLLKLYKSTNILFPPTAMQSEVCSWIHTKIKNGKSVLIYGNTNTGKTSSLFIYLSQHIKENELLQHLKWTESIIYIDCKNDKSAILDFFCNDGEYFRDNVYETSLVIIDNLEAMGRIFRENLLHIIKSSMGMFILIEDTSNVDNALYSPIEIKRMRDSHTFSINHSVSQDCKNCYKKLTPNEKDVYLIIYYITFSTTLVLVKDVFSILKYDYSFIHFKLIMSALIHKGVIKKFPFDHKYILLTNRMHAIKNQCALEEKLQSSELVLKRLYNSKKFPESAWLSFIHLSYQQILQKSVSNKEKLFLNALKCGNYISLYNVLQEELTYCPNKEDLFLYEAGTLYFYNNYQEKAFENYNKLISKSRRLDAKYTTILRIIEATHGDVNISTIKNIMSYLEILESINYEYSLYAQYWRLHIESERGNFHLDKYEELLSNLKALGKHSISQDIFLELIKRSYTDIIRINYILNSLPSEELFADFLEFMHQNYNVIMYQYYKDLYVEANRAHYVILLNNILNNENCQETYNKANHYYENALRNGFENLKSVSACELKSIDLKLFNPDNLINFQDYKIKITKFLSNAEINHVSVHVAYCKTLLAKLYIVKNLYDEDYFYLKNKTKKDSNIKSYLREAKKIYKDFQNEYGIVRIEFLEMLYHLVSISQKKEFENVIQKMMNTLEAHQDYQREIDIISFIKRKLAENESLRMCIIAIIKAYPIIMQ